MPASFCCEILCSFLSWPDVSQKIETVLIVNLKWIAWFIEFPFEIESYCGTSNSTGNNFFGWYIRCFIEMSDHYACVTFRNSIFIVETKTNRFFWVSLTNRVHVKWKARNQVGNCLCAATTLFCWKKRVECMRSCTLKSITVKCVAHVMALLMLKNRDNV